MALYAIGDLHLSFSANKPMDVFGGWDNYVNILRENWLDNISAEDTVVLPGDTSWAMNLEGILMDFKFLDNLPGQKILIKGNHDYWWETRNKMENFVVRNSLSTIKFLHNNAIMADGIAVCGTRGWIFEKGEPHDVKLVNREAIRLKASLDDAIKTWPQAEKVVFLHYPPVYCEEICCELIDILHSYGIKRCFYGHLHGASRRFAVSGEYLGINFKLISADELKFNPLLIRNA